MSIKMALVYRTDMIAGSVTTISYFLVQLLVIKMYFEAGGVTDIAGFDMNDIYLVFAVSQISIMMIYIFVRINVRTAINQINEGKLDFLLTKPADARFLIMIQRFEILQVYGMFIYCMIFGYYLWKVGNYDLDFGQWLVVGFILINSIVLHSLLYWISGLVNLFSNRFLAMWYLINNTYEIVKYPKNVYPRLFQDILIFVFPILLVANPVFDVLDRSWSWSDFVQMILVTFVFLLIFLVVFGYGLRKYESAA